ncbi:MAG: hypothetical protein J0M08_10635, partial [Bacteroidetes bacterium]|nr:hypothetical protein [Bacteroidota bacterium]
IDAITEQTNVSDADGQQYKVNSGSNQYWMNTNGEYIGTNKADYNPNADERLNQENWKKLKEGNE